jgi:hypothetical protein
VFGDQCCRGRSGKLTLGDAWGHLLPTNSTTQVLAVNRLPEGCTNRVVLVGEVEWREVAIGGCLSPFPISTHGTECLSGVLGFLCRTISGARALSPATRPRALGQEFVCGIVIHANARPGCGRSGGDSCHTAPCGGGCPSRGTGHHNEDTDATRRDGPRASCGDHGEPYRRLRRLDLTRSWGDLSVTSLAHAQLV